MNIKTLMGMSSYFLSTLPIFLSTLPTTVIEVAAEWGEDKKEPFP